MVDRCDTEAHWFCFTYEGVPYFACREGFDYNPVIKQHAREARRLGGKLERREGNHAAATLDELRSAWPGSLMEVADDGSFIYVYPHYVQEETECASRELETA